MPCSLWAAGSQLLLVMHTILWLKPASHMKTSIVCVWIFDKKPLALLQRHTQDPNPFMSSTIPSESKHLAPLSPDCFNSFKTDLPTWNLSATCSPVTGRVRQLERCTTPPLCSKHPPKQSTSCKVKENVLKVGYVWSGVWLPVYCFDHLSSSSPRLLPVSHPWVPAHPSHTCYSAGGSHHNCSLWWDAFHCLGHTIQENMNVYTKRTWMVCKGHYFLCLLTVLGWRLPCHLRPRSFHCGILR